MSRLARLGAALLAPGLLIAALAVPTPAAADGAQHLTGSTANGSWVLDVPADFNGTVLLWSHGYSFEPVPATNAPNAATRDALLAQGYALIGSSYARGGAGWAVREGVRAGVEAVGIAAFRVEAGPVQRVYAWGNSLGGLITQTIAERRPDLVDGVAPLCGVLAGTNRNLDLALDVAVGVKRFFHRPLQLTGFRTRAQAQQQYDAASAAVLKALANPVTQAASSGRILALAALSGSAAKTRTFSGTTTTSAVGAATESVLTALNYGTLGRWDIERRVGGNPSTNARTDYMKRVTPESTARFTAWGFGAGLLKAYAQALDTYGARVTADRDARRAASRLGNPRGDLADVTVTMHTVHDPLVIVQNERVFRQRVARAGDSASLMQLYITPPSYTTAAPYGAGHCNFTSDQYVGVVGTLDSWVRSGDRPAEAAVAARFAGQPGALDLDFTPSLWPAR